MGADDSGQADDRGRRRFLMRPVVWLAGIVVAALGVALTNALVRQFGDVIDPIVERGPAVSVDDVTTYRNDEVGNSVVFSSGTSFSDAEIAELNEQTDRVQWLEDRGGVAPSTVLLRMVVSGQRSSPVRVLDVSVQPSCEEPLDGVLFEDPPAGAEDSLQINFDLDDPTPSATYTSESGEEVPFFPERTISLADGESQVVLVSASTDTSYCRFRLSLTVLDGSQTSTVTVPSEGAAPFEVTARVEDTAYEQVYLGGVICGDYVQASEAYFRGDYLNACGPQG